MEDLISPNIEKKKENENYVQRVFMITLLINEYVTFMEGVDKFD